MEKKDIEQLQLLLSACEKVMKEVLETVEDCSQSLDVENDCNDVLIFKSIYDDMCKELGVEVIETMGLS